MTPLPRHEAWQAQRFGRVMLRVFLQIALNKAASSGDKVQIAWQARHLVACDENLRTPRTKHRF